jgi:hypothetical protein
MPSLPAALKGCNFIITLEFSSKEIDIWEDILAGYDALGMTVRSAFGLGGKTGDFRASAFSEGVIAMPVGLTGLRMVK